MEENWYYVTGDAEQAGPVSEGELNALVACGQIRESALVWSENMTDWTPYSAVTRLGAPTYSVPGGTPDAMGYPVPAGLGGWLQFVGIMHIIPGAFVCAIGLLSIITLIGPFLIIPLGALLIVAGTACTGAGAAAARMNPVDYQTHQFLSHIKRYVITYGIIFVAHLVFTLLGFIIFVIASASGAGYGYAY